MKKINFKRLAICLLLPFSAGLIGSLATFEAIPTWYVTLSKPSFSPPNWIFGPVWTTLYILMGISLYLAWTPRNARLFFIHLIFNAFWSIAFFGMKNISLAFIVIIILWGLIAKIIIYFKKTNKLAAYLLIPYFLWVSFATLLNLAILLLNQ